ncbi:MAG: class I SAM-dependent RNA methyltransferase [Myxococcota bacterium]
MTNSASDDTAPEVTISGLGSEGDGVGRLADGRVVFVAGALPGDRVRIALGPTYKRVQYADVLRIIEPSPERIRSRCQVVDCGGCSLRILSMAGQREAKRHRVVQAMRRLGGVDVEDLVGPVVGEGDGWAYRHRVRFHAAWRDHQWRLGYHARRSKKLAPLSACTVLWPELEAAALRLAEALAKLPENARLKEVQLAYSRRDGRAAAVVRGDGLLKAYRRAWDWFEDSGLSGVEIQLPASRFRFGNLELRYDHGRADHFDLRFEPDVFTQANPQINDRLVEAVSLAVRPREGPSVLELHAGIGNFSLPLALSGARITAVETNQRAVLLSRRNAGIHGVDTRIIQETDARAVTQLAPLNTFDVALLDPPRSGAREAVTAFATEGPTRIVYVSCDPATLARDIGLLQGGGYRLTHMQAFDMFAQTPHVEIVAQLSRQ